MRGAMSVLGSFLTTLEVEAAIDRRIWARNFDGELVEIVRHELFCRAWAVRSGVLE